MNKRVIDEKKMLLDERIMWRWCLKGDCCFEKVYEQPIGLAEVNGSGKTKNVMLVDTVKVCRICGSITINRECRSRPNQVDQINSTEKIVPRIFTKLQKG